MANKILSVVVPTYNMETYLPRCLDSVTREDIPDTLEVIVINDGSKDRSLEIAKEYQAKRPDIISIIDKPNGHYGSCINAALKVATGKYFRPLDADDWFDTDSLIQLLTTLETTDVDLVITPFFKISQFERTKEEIRTNYVIKQSTDFSVFEKKHCEILSMHALTYKTNLLKEIHYKQTEHICYTDLEYVLYPLPNVKKFIYIDKCLYNYDITRENRSTDNVVVLKNRNHFASILKNYLANCYSDNFPKFIKMRLADFLHYYFFLVIFNKQNKLIDAEAKIVYRYIQKKDSNLLHMLNKAMYGTTFVWSRFSLHFSIFSKHFMH